MYIYVIENCEYYLAMKNPLTISFSFAYGFDKSTIDNEVCVFSPFGYSLSFFNQPFSLSLCR